MQPCTQRTGPVPGSHCPVLAGGWLHGHAHLLGNYSPAHPALPYGADQASRPQTKRLLSKQQIPNSTIIPRIRALHCTCLDAASHLPLCTHMSPAALLGPGALTMFHACLDFLPTTARLSAGHRAPDPPDPLRIWGDLGWESPIPARSVQLTVILYSWLCVQSLPSKQPPPQAPSSEPQRKPRLPLGAVRWRCSLPLHPSVGCDVSVMRLLERFKV